MDGIDVSLAPGCYGMGMCFKEGSSECGTCPFVASCKPLGEAQLAMIRKELGITPPKPKAAPATPARPSAIAAAMTVGVPKKVAAWLDYIEQQQIKVTTALREGVNPFTGRRPQFLNVACHLLLRCETGVPREMLKQAFARKLNWSEETVAAHVTQTRQILLELGAVDDVDGVLRLRAN